MRKRLLSEFRRMVRSKTGLNEGKKYALYMVAGRRRVEVTSAFFMKSPGYAPSTFHTREFKDPTKHCPAYQVASQRKRLCDLCKMAV